MNRSILFVGAGNKGLDAASVTTSQSTALAGVIFVVSSACLIGLLVVKKEFSDEMSERNLAEAQASTLLKLQLIFCFAAMALLLAANFPFGWDVNWRRVLVSALFFAVGISDCMTGLTFRKLEAE